MEINRNNVFKIINNCNLKPEKDFGQNFLIEPEVCKKIVSFLDIKEDEKILEIGPGLGSLTHYLCLSKADVTAVDVDSRMIDFLKIALQEFTNITLVNKDIRDFDSFEVDKVIGNLPYNITTEIIIHLLKKSHQLKKIVLMCQLETLAHFVDVEGKEYGPTSVFIHLIGDCKKLLTVKAGSFHPVPKCNSAVFEIVLRKDVDLKEALEIYTFAKQIFLNRRKTIYNNLNALVKDKTKTLTILKEAGLMENLRPEQISPNKIKTLYEFFMKINNSCLIS